MQKLYSFTLQLTQQVVYSEEKKEVEEMKVDNRHSDIISYLKKADEPVSGSALSKEFNVSRQIIVQDINQLRDKGYSIISTTKGYVLENGDEVTKVFKVRHTIEETEKELKLVVDLGAEVRDVFIYHKIYDKIRAKLCICSRRDVKVFCDKLMSGKSAPLMTATDGYHYHTIVAKDVETMRMVEKALSENGFIAERTEYEPDEMD